MNARNRIGDAIIRCCQDWPYARDLLMSLEPVEKPECGTAAVDQHARLYFAPDFVQQHAAEDWQIDFIIKHEASHIMLRHFARALRIGIENDANKARLWNVAADAAIHEVMAAEGVRLMDIAVTAAKLNLPPNQSAEQYFAALLKRQQESPQGPPSGHGTQQGPNDGEPTKQPSEGQNGSDSGQWQGGSCADGQTRDYEDPFVDEPFDGSAGSGEAAPGLSEGDLDQILQNVADAIQHSASQGSGRGGGFARCADHLKPPRFNPEQLLKIAVSNRFSKLRQGHQLTSFRRPSRRPSLDRNVIMPRRFTADPDVVVIIDTSGSMGHDDLGLALGMVAKVLRSLQAIEGVRVVTGDTTAESAKQCFRHSDVDLLGGGGTDMGRIIEEVAGDVRKHPCDVIICVTDGYTPWPERKLRVPVIAALTRPSPMSRVPSWIKAVCVRPDQE